MNEKYITKQIEKYYDEVKYQLFSIDSSVVAHPQGNDCLIIFMTTLKRT